MQLSGRHAGLIIPVAVVGAAALIVSLAGRPSDAALSSATPAQGISLVAPPTAVTLTFTVPVSEAHITVTGARVEAPAVIDDGTVTQPVTATAAGNHVVEYHVVLRAGGELSGALSFAVGNGAAAPEPPPQPAATGGHDHGSLDPITGTVLAANLVVLLLLAYLFLRRPRRKHDPEDGPGTEPAPAGDGPAPQHVTTGDSNDRGHE
jgi:methionine-rich copper-binding protein CopC